MISRPAESKRAEPLSREAHCRTSVPVGRPRSSSFRVRPRQSRARTEVIPHLRGKPEICLRIVESPLIRDRFAVALETGLPRIGCWREIPGEASTLLDRPGHPYRRRYETGDGVRDQRLIRINHSICKIGLQNMIHVNARPEHMVQVNSPRGGWPGIVWMPGAREECESCRCCEPTINSG